MTCPFPPAFLFPLIEWFLSDFLWVVSSYYSTFAVRSAGPFASGEQADGWVLVSGSTLVHLSLSSSFYYHQRWLTTIPSALASSL
mmetsp:Transcript_12410/g.20651  ORF Transcript_12410/g.20651 Transcript_12410/m.20651 type:complete len:85 (+) Transcript_12410:338-592(+)